MRNLGDLTHDNDDPKLLKELESKTQHLKKEDSLRNRFDHFIEIMENPQPFTVSVLNQTITVTSANLPQQL